MSPIPNMHSWWWAAANSMENQNLVQRSETYNLQCERVSPLVRCGRGACLIQGRPEKEDQKPHAQWHHGLLSLAVIR